MSDDDRPRRKKSWREIDRQKDRSAHRKEEPKPGPGRRRGGDPSRSHRAALDHLFDSGKIGELVQQRDAATGVSPDEAGPSRRKLSQQIEEAATRDAKIAAIDRYLETFSLPKDFDTLAQMLDHPDPDVVTSVLEQVEILLEDEKPRRPRTLIAQLKSVAELSEWGKLRKRATALLARL
jgi:hypothetical protein